MWCFNRISSFNSSRSTSVIFDWEPHVGTLLSHGRIISLGSIVNREDSIRKFIRKLGAPEQLRACYEAGPTGFVRCRLKKSTAISMPEVLQAS